MRRALLLGIVLVIVTTACAVGQVYGPAAMFRVSLSPHGEWIRYNENIVAWRPTWVPVGWQPYTVGHWAWTSYGWYWDSDEPWAWATYHYGRWDYDPYYGWIWFPDVEWAPAWVEWRHGAGYVGWYPQRPLRPFNWHVNVVLYQPDRWVFVPYKDMVRHDVCQYQIPAKERRRVFGHTSPLDEGKNGRDVGRTVGPSRREVERNAGVRLTEQSVRDTPPRASQPDQRKNQSVVPRSQGAEKGTREREGGKDRGKQLRENTPATERDSGGTRGQ